MSHIEVQAYNPYEARFPGRRVVSRDGLLLIKALRTAGHDVHVVPNNGTKVQYLFEKGVGDVLAHPLFIALIGVPLAVATTLITQWVSSRRTERTDPRSGDGGNTTRVVIEVAENGQSLSFDESGRPLSEEKLRELLTLLDRRRREYAETLVQEPDREFPASITLEHTAKIVGWGNLQFTERGMEIRPARIDDDETWNRLQAGELRGWSIGGIAKGARCTICGGDFVECPHVSGDLYDGKKCAVEIYDLDLAEISIVREPVHSLAKVRIAQKKRK